MTDIVERLRFWAAKKPDLLPAIACGEAADEIERLRKTTNQLEAKLHCMCGMPMDHSAWEGHTGVSMYDYSLDKANEEIEKLRACIETLDNGSERLVRERDRLRAELEKYGGHEADCLIFNDKGAEDGTCNCGFKAALSGR